MMKISPLKLSARSPAELPSELPSGLPAKFPAGLRNALVAGLCAITFSGCTTISYFWQAFAGQMEVRRLSRPVEEVLADSATGADLKRRLEYATRARDFASQELALPDNRSYRLYADLQRPFVVWNVFVAPELSLDLKTFCFPVAGCVPYRGYFAKEVADTLAAELRQAGDDVYVSGVPAYSTLGWFDDPLLNTFMRFPELEIARLIFHELAHQVAYVKDDTTFNESYAVAVEDEGIKRWIKLNATPAQITLFESYRQRQRELIGLLMRGRERLGMVYAGSGGAAVQRTAKAQVIEALKLEYAGLKEGWNLTEAEKITYDGWFFRGLNNARLGTVAVYTEHVARFARMIVEAGGDMQKFHTNVKNLAALPKAERLVRLGAVH